MEQGAYSTGGAGATQSAYVVEIKTVQALAIKILFEGLKEVLTDIPIEIDKTGIKLSALDTSNVVLTNVRLAADRFDFFHVSEERITIGLNVLHLCKLLRSVSNSDTLTLFMEEVGGDLGIRIESRERNAKTVFRLSLLDLPEEETCPITGSASFDDIIILDSGDLQRLCRDMNAIADSVEIRVVKGEVTFSCRGEFCSQETVMYNMKDDGAGGAGSSGGAGGAGSFGGGAGNSGGYGGAGVYGAGVYGEAAAEPGGGKAKSRVSKGSAVVGGACGPGPSINSAGTLGGGCAGGGQQGYPADEIQHGIFNLKFMTHFTKFGALSDVVELLLRNNFPLCVRYNVASLGELKLAIAPQLPD
jgi:proliferating cell nuclear antigen